MIYSRIFPGCCIIPSFASARGTYRVSGSGLALVGTLLVLCFLANPAGGVTPGWSLESQQSGYGQTAPLNSSNSSAITGIKGVSGALGSEEKRYPDHTFGSGDDSLMSDGLAAGSLRMDQTPHSVSRPLVNNYNDSASVSGASDYAQEFSRERLISPGFQVLANRESLNRESLNRESLNRESLNRESLNRESLNRAVNSVGSTGAFSPQTQPAVVRSEASTSWFESLNQDPYHRFHGTMDEREVLMILDAKDGRFQNYSLLSASLIAGGTVQNSQLEHYQIRFENCVRRISQIMPLNADPLVKAQVILEFMHREMFRKYLLESSSLSALFDDGIYNCVTGVVIFNSFARRFGLNVSGLELPGHAMSRLYYGSTHYDVETTCEIWFKLQSMPGKQEQVIARMLQAGVAAQAPDTPIVRREINDVELVAKLYYNRGVDQLARQDYSLALQCNAKALSLDPDSFTAKGNFLATINNWAISESKSGNYEQAMSLLRQGIQIDPQYAIFRNNHVHIYHQWIETKCRQMRYDEALTLSRQAISESPQEEHFRKLESYALMALAQQRNLAATELGAGSEMNTAQPTNSVSASVAYPH